MRRTGGSISRHRPRQQHGRVGGQSGGGRAQHCGPIQAATWFGWAAVCQVMTATRAALELTTIARTGGKPLRCQPPSSLRAHEPAKGSTNAMYVDMERWPNSLTADLVLRLADPRIESVGETRTYFAASSDGLPMPRAEFEIKDSAWAVRGTRRLRMARVGCLPGVRRRIKYEKLLREGERASDVVFREKRREEIICRLTGWRCIRVSWEDLENPTASRRQHPRRTVPSRGVGQRERTSWPIPALLGRSISQEVRVSPVSRGNPAPYTGGDGVTMPASASAASISSREMPRRYMIASR